MQIRYVVSTMVFWWREHHLSFEQECQFLQSLGFGVELWPTIRGLQDCRYERRNWPRLQAATEGMLVAMRSRNDKPSLEQWIEQIECAQLLKANLVVDLESLRVRTGSLPDDWDFAGRIIAEADKKNVRLCLETGPLEILQQLGRTFGALWYCLDTGYANLDPNVPFERYVDELAPRLSHVHLADNYGYQDDHEPPGVEGGISLQRWTYLLEGLKRCNNEVIGSFEMCPCMPGVMIRQAGEFMFDIMKWPNRPYERLRYSDISCYPM